MILNVSGRTDIVAFYTPWFMKRYREGFVDVRNPFNPKLISRISFNDVDLIVFCTKNPKPILKYIKEIKKPILFQITLTSYKKDIEPNVINKNEIIECIKELSNIIGKDFISVRYDPIFISDKYNINYHIKAFDRLCSKLSGYVNNIIISFIDEYKNVLKNLKALNYHDITDDEYEIIGKEFSRIAKENNLIVQTCFEKRDLIEYGFTKSDCVPITLAYTLTGKKFPKWHARKGDLCNCAQMVDIGVYNSCRHFCKYCYANFDEKKVNQNFSKHDINSTLLVGHIEKDDIIKERKK